MTAAYGEKVKAYLRRGAKPIRGEVEYPNEKVGYGAVCVENSLSIPQKCLVISLSTDYAVLFLRFLRPSSATEVGLFSDFATLLNDSRNC